MSITKEELQEILTEHLNNLRSEILAEVVEKDKGVAANLSRQIEKLAVPKEKTEIDSEEAVETDKRSPQILALQKQIEELKAEREQEKAAVHKAAKEKALFEAVSLPTVANSKVLKNYLLNQIDSKLEQDGDSWFVKNSDEDVSTLNDYVSSFLSTEEGALFVKPSNTKGAGSKPPSIPTSAKGDSNKPKGFADQFAGLTEQLSKQL